MDLGVSGKTYAIIGGSYGMGGEAAEVLAADGANLVLVARTRGTLEERCRELSNLYGITAIAAPADGAIPGSVETALATALEQTEIHGLAQVTGIMRSFGTFHELSDEAWDEYYQGILMLTVRSIRAVIPHMLERGSGTIVTTAAYSTRSQKPPIVHYTAMKAAAASMTKNLARTYGARGIRSNCVCPGMIDTAMIPAEETQFYMDKYGVDRDVALVKRAEDMWGMRIDMQRTGKPREIGDLIAILLSDRAAYLNGTTINIDGGTDFF